MGSNNRQNNANRQLLDTERQRSNTQYNQFNTQQQEDSNTYRTNTADTRQGVIDRYSNNNNFLPPGMAPNSSGFFSAPPGIQSAGGDFGSAKTGYQKLADTGGVNRADFDPALDSYKEFMKTGGVSEGAADVLRQRALGQVPAFYNQYKNSLARRQNVQGGYSPGFDAQQEEIGREAGRQGFQASRQVEGDILDRRLQGAEFGTSGYGNLMSDITGREQTGKIAGLGGLTNIGGMEQQNSQFNAGQMNDFQRQMIDAYQRGGITNAAGLAGVHAQDVGQYQNARSGLLQGIGGQGAQNLNNINSRNAIQDTHWYDRLPGLLGGAGGFFGGLGGIKKFAGLFGGKPADPRYENPYSVDNGGQVDYGGP